MVFTGTYEHSIDLKHRLAIPADVRAQIESESPRQFDKPVQLFVALIDGPTLALYTRDGFEQRAKELTRSLSNDETETYERLTFSLARQVEIDKQGRILLPENLLTLSGLGTEVVLIGVNDHLEIRDRKTWQEYIARVLAQQPQLLMNPRRALRKTETPPS